jgi:type III pantothenate kinase
MILLVDMGNSRLKSAVCYAGDLSVFHSEAYAGRKAIDCLSSHLLQQDNVTDLALVSVRGKGFEADVRELCQHEGIRLHWAGSVAQAHGVKNLYRQPETLGSDRFVALVGARQLFANECCIVVDCGTAVTIDGLTADGEFSGGVIIPGLRLWGDSLIQRADQLNEHHLQHPEIFARDTAQAIGSGSLYGLIGAIEGICQRMQDQFETRFGPGVQVRRILCGGDAGVIAEHAQSVFQLQPHLVLQGLARFADC